MRSDAITTARRTHFLLLGILILALALRLWGIAFGLPHISCRPDETTVMRIIYSYRAALAPEDFNYPSLYRYALLGLFSVYYALGLAFGRYSSFHAFIAEYEIDPTVFYLINRCAAATLGTLTVLLVYRIARDIADRRTGLTAALFLSLAYLHVRDSHFGVTDVPMTFLVTLSVLLLLRALRRGTTVAYMVAGLASGLAASTKYNGLMLIAPALAANAVHVFDRREPWGDALLGRRLVMFGVTMVAGFALGTPYALLRPGSFAADVFYEIQHLGHGHSIALGRGWWYHLRFSLLYGLGGGLLFASLAGAVILFSMNWRKWLVLLSFPMLYYLVSGKGYLVFVRYMVPMLPFLCITAAIFAAWLARVAAGRLRQPAGAMLAAISVLIVAQSAYRAISFDRLLARTDSRILAASWFYEHVPPGSGIAQFGSFYGKLQLFPTVDSLSERARSANDNSSVLREKIRRTESLAGAAGYWRLPPVQLLHERTDDLPPYIVLEESPLRAYSTTPGPILALVRAEYEPAASFVAVDPRNNSGVYDQQDAFYLPYAGFSGVERPGPNIYIFRRRDSSAPRTNPSL